MLLFCAVLIISLLSAGIRVLLTTNCLDAHYGVYRSGEILPTVYHIALFVIVILAVAAAILISKRVSGAVPPPVGDFTIFASCISAFMLAASTLLSLYYILIRRQPASVYDWLMIIASVPAIIFFLSLIKTKLNSRAALTFASFFPTAWCAVLLIRVYFDTSLLITNPHKTLHQLALLAAMVYFLNESRFLLSKSSRPLFLAASATAPILLLSSSLPALILPDLLLIGSSDSFIDYAVECALAVFILSRLFCAGASRPENAVKDIPADTDASIE